LTNTKTEFHIHLITKGKRPTFILQLQITLLLDEPGWLIAHHKLCIKEHQLKKNYAFFDQNGGNSLEISPDYFEKFIKDIAKKSRHKRHGV
jgi:non-specific serine/threonine protein kinase